VRVRKRTPCHRLMACHALPLLMSETDYAKVGRSVIWPHNSQEIAFSRDRPPDSTMVGAVGFEPANGGQAHDLLNPINRQRWALLRLGGRLRHGIVGSGRPLRCLARKPGFLRPQVTASTEVIRGDVLEMPSLAEAMNDVHAAYHPVHSMAEGRGFESRFVSKARAHWGRLGDVPVSSVYDCGCPAWARFASSSILSSLV